MFAPNWVKSSKATFSLGLLLTCIFLILKCTDSDDDGSALSKSAGKSSGSVRDSSKNFEVILKDAVRNLKSAKSERRAGNTSPFLLEEKEVEKFLAERGKTATSVAFVFLVTEDLKWLEELRNLPEGRNKNIFLSRFAQSDKEVLKYSRLLYEENPQSLLGRLLYSEGLSRDGHFEEADRILEDLSLGQQSPTPEDFGTIELLKEFREASKFFGAEKGGDILENHGQKWSSGFVYKYKDYLLDARFSDVISSGDYQNFEENVSRFLGEFFASVGVPASQIEMEKAIATRDFIGYNRRNFEGSSNEVNEALERLSQEADLEFVGGLNRSATFYSSRRIIQLDMLESDFFYHFKKE